MLFSEGDHEFFVAYTMFCCTKDPSYFCNTTEYYSTLTYDNTIDPTRQNTGVKPGVADTINLYSSPPPSLLTPRSTSTSNSFSPPADADPPRCVRCRAFLDDDTTMWCEDCSHDNLHLFCQGCQNMLADDARYCHACGQSTSFGGS